MMENVFYVIAENTFSVPFEVKYVGWAYIFVHIVPSALAMQPAGLKTNVVLFCQSWHVGSRLAIVSS